MAAAPEVVSVLLEPTAEAGFGMSVGDDARIVGLVSQPDGAPGPAEVAGVGTVLGGRVVAANGTEVADGTGLAAALQGCAGAVEFWIERPAETPTAEEAAVAEGEALRLPVGHLATQVRPHHPPHLRMNG